MRLTNVNGSGREEVLPTHAPRGRRTFDTIELWEEDFLQLARMTPTQLAAWLQLWHLGFPPTLQS